jgi:hypothetical protein
MPSGLRFLSSTLLLLSCIAEGAGATELIFAPQEPAFSEAVEEYKAIWESEGERIVDALQTATGLRLETGPIRAIVCECVSYSGYGDTPMQLRASYPGATKRGTLVHELSHRLISGVAPESVDQHQAIFLFVYDVWVQLWGKEFADAQVVVESGRRGLYDYESAWRDALALGPAGRRERWRALLDQWSL